MEGCFSVSGCQKKNASNSSNCPKKAPEVSGKSPHPTGFDIANFPRQTITKPVIFAEDVFGSKEQQKIGRRWINVQKGTQDYWIQNVPNKQTNKQTNERTNERTN